MFDSLRIQPTRWLFSFVCAVLLVMGMIFGTNGRACTAHFSVMFGVAWVEIYFLSDWPYMVGVIVVLACLLYLFFGRVPVESSNQARLRATAIIISTVVVVTLFSALLTPPNQHCNPL